MKAKENIEKLNEREWNELASLFSGKATDHSGAAAGESGDDKDNWEKLRKMDNKVIDVDKAWNKVYSRIRVEEQVSGKKELNGFLRPNFLKIAASILVMALLGITSLYLGNQGYFSREITVKTGDARSLSPVRLPDGSIISLNRNTVLSYRSHFGKSRRNVRLNGEAFFEISHDASRPFIIDAGKADIRVVGTSFNVITSNKREDVEVFVETGKVLLSDKAGSSTLELEPGFIGTMSNRGSEKSVNKNPNYMSWNTGRLVYKGEKLNTVFNDLRKIYGSDIVTDDPAILENPWTTTIDVSQPEDIIILLVCNTFNLGYTKDGNTYHLFKK